MEPAADFVLIDALTLPELSIAQYPIIKGDALSASIAAASIVAKETRDDMMRAYSELYPEYGFAKHKGYGTRDHMDAIRAHGASPLHRRSFLKEYHGGIGMGVRSLKDQRAVGRQKEKKAAMFLSKGYRILEHSYRTPCGEIDLIAEHEGRIIFVEVKYRRSLRFGQTRRGCGLGASSGGSRGRRIAM
ncbi:MAG: YraN family protein [Clostridia bacterium]